MTTSVSGGGGLKVNIVFWTFVICGKAGLLAHFSASFVFQNSYFEIK